MLAQTLKDNGVPYYQRIENFCGLEFAMDPLPVQGPGIFFKVLVPEGAAQEAKEILAHLPISPGNPGLWSFSPKPWAKKFIIVMSVLYLIALLLNGLSTIIHWLQ